MYNQYDYLLKPNNNTDKIPAGTYTVKIKNIGISQSKNNNDIIITKFEIISGVYCKKPIKYIRTIPTEIQSKSGQFKQKLLQSFISGLGISSFDELDSVIGKIYNINVFYNNHNDYLDISFVN